MRTIPGGRSSLRSWDARRYAQIKYRLAEAYRHDRHGYTDAEVPHVWEIMARADRWSQEVEGTRTDGCAMKAPATLPVVARRRSPV